MLRIRMIVPALCALSIAACGGSGGGSDSSTSPTGGNNTPTTPINNDPVNTSSVTLTTDSFTPTNITIATGTTVNWTWNSCTTAGDGYGGTGTTTCVTHTVTFDDGVASDPQSSGSFSRLFTVAGTYNYHCAIHGSAMSGKVVVQ
jgi:plastocyanin